MSPVIPRNVRLDDTVWEALREVHDRDGVPVAEQIRRAVNEWLKVRGVQPIDFDTTAYDKPKRVTRKKARSS